MREGTPNATHNEIMFYRIKAFVKKKKSEAGFPKNQSGMFTARLLESSAHKWWDHRAPSPRQSQRRRAHTNPLPLLHGRLALLHTFCHLTQTCGARWWQMLRSTGPRGHEWPFGLSFFFFSPSVAKNYLFDNGRQCYPQASNGAGKHCCLSFEITSTWKELSLCVHKQPSPCLSMPGWPTRGQALSLHASSWAKLLHDYPVV